MLGLVGSHRVGKTTLMHAFSEDSGIKAVATSTSAVFERLGFDPREDYDFRTRLFIQNEILSHVERQYREAGRLFVTDRTPIDMLAYTMADVQRANLVEGDAEAFGEYLKRCIDTTNRHFAALIVIQPGIKVVEVRKSAPGNSAYMEHINTLALGLLAREDLSLTKVYIASGKLDLKDRVKAVHAAYEKAMRRYRELGLAGGLH